MYRVQFIDFRCFSQMKPIDVRPITLLIGENSAGKTSFLAGLRFLLESFSAGSRNAFNRDPFFLGGFDQIAYYKGGKIGRAKSFSLSIEIQPGNEKPWQRKSNLLRKHSFSFSKGSSQPALDIYGFEADGMRAEITLKGDKPDLRVMQSDNPSASTKINLDVSPPAALIRENVSFIPFLMRDFHNTGLHNLGSKQKIISPGKSPRKVIGPNDILSLRRAFNSSADTLSQNVFASAPVRTQPLRTYTPSDLIASSEGSHVPLELSRAKSSDPERWTAIREGLISFGESSGLFSDIDIRQLGKGDIDPFQIMVKTNGPSTNLADVGYGISQVLPIIYQVQQSSRNGTYLLQQPEVHLHPRAQAELGSLLTTTIKSKDNRPTFIVETHSDYLVDRIRIEIAEKKISPNDVTIIFFQKNKHGSTVENLSLNEKGELQKVPDEFRSFFLEEHGKLLGL